MRCDGDTEILGSGLYLLFSFFGVVPIGNAIDHGATSCVALRCVALCCVVLLQVRSNLSLCLSLSLSLCVCVRLSLTLTLTLYKCMYACISLSQSASCIGQRDIRSRV